MSRSSTSKKVWLEQRRQWHDQILGAVVGKATRDSCRLEAGTDNSPGMAVWEELVFL
ncbi:MAG: hypothetical protein JO235_26560 [Chroococcidiopsidaceae cyanobacterium CP_BM_RX_35]|nr:hypothetical protein [Chroococcidiopsidaceae cyanobacterium CP_BM_RX_35]